MKLVSLTIEGYRQFASRQSVTFPDGLIGICGPNGSGKSKLIEAIGYAFFGPRRTLPDGDTDRDVLAAATPGDAAGRVELVFRLGSQEFRVERDRHGAALYDAGSASPVARGKSDVTRCVQRLLHLSPATFRGTFVARQRDIAGLQGPAISDRERVRLINHLIGVLEIERAIQYASEELRVRSTAFDAAKSAVSMSATEAREREARARTKRGQAREDADRWDAAYLRATQLARQAGEEAAALRERAAQAARSRQELARVEEWCRTLESNTTNAKRQLQEAIVAERARVRAREEMAATASAVEQAEHQRCLQNIAAILAERGREQAKLEGSLADQLTRRERVASELLALRQPLGRVRAALQAIRDRAVTAQTNAQNQRARETRARQQHAHAKELGHDGPCEYCGATLEDRLDAVLTRLENEAAAAAAAAKDFDQVAAQARREIERLERSEKDLQGRAQTLQQRLDSEFGQVLGEIRATNERIQMLDEALGRERGRLPLHLRDADYDAAAQEEAEAGEARYRQAERSLNANATMAGKRAEFQAALTETRAALNRAAARRRELEVEIARTAVTPEQLAAAADAESEARRGVSEAEAGRLSATADLATAEAELEQAERMVTEAVAAERRVAAALRDVGIAERTKILLESVLTTVSNEARPRLVELMDEWLRPLLGRRFTRIELTEDYRLMADNGSGLHVLDHFSGGEQTALAIMLRAAISLFCRERAGFDTGFLVFDEVFGDQDATRRNLLVQFLEQIKPHYHQIIVVNHIDEVTGSFDTVLQVSRVGPNESVVSVQT